MTWLIVGLVLFLGLHSVSIVAPAWRQAQIERRGENAWKGVYSVVSLIGFVALVYGYGQARLSPTVLYAPPAALRHLSLLLMLPVFVLLIAAYFPGRIRRATRHPMLVAVMLWATAHLLANGTLAAVLLFGGFLVWAAIDRISVAQRSSADQHGAPAAPVRTYNDAIALVGGLAVYVLFIGWAHRWLIGVSPLAAMGGSS